MGGESLQGYYSMPCNAEPCRYFSYSGINNTFCRLEHGLESLGILEASREERLARSRHNYHQFALHSTGNRYPSMAHTG